MMNRQTIIALGVAVVLGLMAVFLANTWLAGKQRQVYAGGTTKVAVATSPLAFGSEVTPDKVRFVDYPNSSLPPGAFTNAAALMPPGKKRVALLPIAVNEPILASKISAQGQGASIAALLPDGMRAASVRLNDVSGVAGFIQPNDSVDVLVTREINNADRNAQVTDVLLQNVRVIAIDQEAKNADGTPKIAKTATLQVTPIDAQKLALAQEVGSLSLVLRKAGEQNDPVVETVSMNDLRYNMYGGARYPTPAVVGAFGSGLAPAIAGAMNRTAATLAARSARPHATNHKSAGSKSSKGDSGQEIQVFRGTKGDQVKVGGYAD
jgi:pilus assembly protein CpaB